MSFTDSQSKLWQHGMSKEEQTRLGTAAKRQWEKDLQNEWSKNNRAAIKAYWRHRQKTPGWGHNDKSLGAQALRLAMTEGGSVAGGSSMSSSASQPSLSAPGTPAGLRGSRASSSPSMKTFVQTLPGGLTCVRKVDTSSAGSAKDIPLYHCGEIELPFRNGIPHKPNEYKPVVDGRLCPKPVPGCRYGTPDNRLGQDHISAKGPPRGSASCTMFWEKDLTRKPKGASRLADTDPEAVLNRRKIPTAKETGHYVLPTTHHYECGPQCFCMKFQSAPWGLSPAQLAVVQQ
eukprot:TRINITY_DN25708_c0_g1_i1.p1 TRINITY_DN25708_c0_g1~~TRINITY_DN25708_c0_g1_i1.p1  ORF type:complete len:317 (+),score=44.91 TRINITY_DN25708_c0_g1_i1:90-953(+)